MTIKMKLYCRKALIIQENFAYSKELSLSSSMSGLMTSPDAKTSPAELNAAAEGCR